MDESIRIKFDECKKEIKDYSIRLKSLRRSL